MAQRILEIDLISGKDLKNVNFITKMDVYVVVSISGDSEQSEQKAKYPVDHDGGNNPAWNLPVKFTINEAAAQQNRLNLVFKLRCERALGDKDIGEVNVSVKDLLDAKEDGKLRQFVTYQVTKPSGKPKGELRFSYKFGDKMVVDKVNSVTTFPPPPATVVCPSTPPPYVAGAGPGPGPCPPQSSVVAGYGYPPSPSPPAHAYSGFPPPPAYAYGGFPPPPAYAYSGYTPPTAYAYGGFPPPPPPAYAYGGYPPAVYEYPPAAPAGGYGYPPVFFGLGLGAGC